MIATNSRLIGDILERDPAVTSYCSLLNEEEFKRLISVSLLPCVGYNVTPKKITRDGMLECEVELLIIDKASDCDTVMNSVNNSSIMIAGNVFMNSETITECVIAHEMSRESVNDAPYSVTSCRFDITTCLQS